MQTVVATSVEPRQNTLRMAGGVVTHVLVLSHSLVLKVYGIYNVGSVATTQTNPRLTILAFDSMEVGAF